MDGGIRHAAADDQAIDMCTYVHTYLPTYLPTNKALFPPYLPTYLELLSPLFYRGDGLLNQDGSGRIGHNGIEPTQLPTYSSSFESSLPAYLPTLSFCLLCSTVGMVCSIKMDLAALATMA